MMIRRYDPASQSVRDADDTTTGVLFDEGRPPVVVGRHGWRGPRHARPTARWRVVTVMVTVPLLAAAVVVQSLPGDRPGQGGSASSAMWDQPTPETRPTGDRAQTAVRTPENDATPGRVGSVTPTPDTPRTATVGTPSMAPRVDAEPCTRRRCVPWSGGGSSGRGSRSSSRPAGPSPLDSLYPSLTPSPSGGTP